MSMEYVFRNGLHKLNLKSKNWPNIVMRCPDVGYRAVAKKANTWDIGIDIDIGIIGGGCDCGGCSCGTGTRQQQQSNEVCSNVNVCRFILNNEPYPCPFS
jgi:hypothetical protein